MTLSSTSLRAKRAVCGFHFCLRCAGRACSRARVCARACACVYVCVCVCVCARAVLARAVLARAVLARALRVPSAVLPHRPCQRPSLRCALGAWGLCVCVRVYARVYARVYVRVYVLPRARASRVASMLHGTDLDCESLPPEPAAGQSCGWREGRLAGLQACRLADLSECAAK